MGSLSSAIAIQQFPYRLRGLQDQCHRDSAILRGNALPVFPRCRRPSITYNQQNKRVVRCFTLSPPWQKRDEDAAAVVGPRSDDKDLNSEVVDCVIVGAGISGLCIAHALNTKSDAAGLDVIVTEARDRVGGNITTVERDGYLWEEGPNSFQPSDPMLTMAVDSGLKDELVLGDPNAPRFVLWDGKLRPVPSRPIDLLFFDLMSFGGKLRAAIGAFGFRPSHPGHEESVEDFVRRNLGDEVFERLIEPFCSEENVTGLIAADVAAPPRQPGPRKSARIIHQPRKFRDYI